MGSNMFWSVAQEDSVSPYEEFERVFSKFASAEEVTGARVDADAQEEAEEEKEEEAAKVHLTACCLQ